MACRLCLYIFEGNDGTISSSSDFVSSDYVLAISTIPELDLELSSEVLICHTCTQTLNIFRDFKETCQRTENKIDKYKKTNGKLSSLTDLVKFYEEAGNSAKKDAIVCCTCLECLKSGQYESFLEEPYLVKFLGSYLDVQTILSTNCPVICKNCVSLIEELYDFKQMCLTTQKIIASFHQTRNKVIKNEDLILIAKKRGVKMQTSSVSRIKQERGKEEIRKETGISEEENKEQAETSQDAEDVIVVKEEIIRDTGLSEEENKEQAETSQDAEDAIVVKEEIQIEENILQCSDVSEEDTLQCSDASILENADVTEDTSEYIEEEQTESHFDAPNITESESECIQDDSVTVNENANVEMDCIQQSINDTATVMFENFSEETSKHRDSVCEIMFETFSEEFLEENTNLEKNDRRQRTISANKGNQKSNSKTIQKNVRRRNRTLGRKKLDNTPSETSNQKTHVLVYDGTLFTCKTCNLVSPCKDLMHDHIKYNSTQITQKCVACNAKVRSGVNVNPMKKRRVSCNAINKFSFKCSKCPHTSKQESTMANHIKRVHGKSDSNSGMLLIIDDDDDDDKEPSRRRKKNMKNAKVDTKTTQNSKKPVQKTTEPNAVDVDDNVKKITDNSSIIELIELSSEDEATNKVETVKKCKKKVNMENYRLLNCVVCRELFEIKHRTKHILYKRNVNNNAGLFKCLNCNYIVSLSLND